MEIKKTIDNKKLTIALSGRLDTTTAPEFEASLKESIDGITELVLDFKELVYVSSAGLRVILSAQKIMNKQGEMVVTGANEDIMDVFEITGFSDFIKIV